MSSSHTLLVARISGILLFLTMFTAPISEISIREAGIMVGDPENTVKNVLASLTSFKIACILDVIMVVVEIAMIGLFYILFEEVSRALSLIASYFRLFFLIFLIVRVFLFLSVQHLLEDAQSYNFTGIYEEIHQQSIVALLFFKIQLFMKDVSMIFLALHCVLLGILMYKSKRVPGLYGIGMVFSGFGYLVAGSAFLVAPPSFRDTAYGMLMFTSLVGDPVFSLYLLSLNFVVGRRWLKTKKN